MMFYWLLLNDGRLVIGLDRSADHCSWAIVDNKGYHSAIREDEIIDRKRIRTPKTEISHTVLKFVKGQTSS